MINVKKYDITQSEFEKLKALIYETAGIHLSDAKRQLVVSRYSKRLRELELESFDQYYDMVTSDKDSLEIQNFVNSITTNKTDFFRERHHFEFLRDVFIPALNRNDTVKIWSSGCSTGEEPYSIAMVMHKYFVEPMSGKVEILATDIDTSVLYKAGKGIYEEELVNQVPMNLRKKYFLRGKGHRQGFFKIKDELKEMVNFKQMNFMRDEYPFSKNFDIIFCRNVIIYFSTSDKKKVVKRLVRHVKKGGFFIIGHSETLFNMIDGLSYQNNTIYRKEY